MIAAGLSILVLMNGNPGTRSYLDARWAKNACRALRGDRMGDVAGVMPGMRTGADASGSEYLVNSLDASSLKGHAHRDRCGAPCRSPPAGSCLAPQSISGACPAGEYPTWHGRVR